MKSWLMYLAIGLVLGVVLNVAWWAVVVHPLDPGGEELTIPAGTAAAIGGREPFAFAPDRFQIPAGGRLRVVNRDSVAHTVGSTTIPPGATADVAATASGEITCTIHPEGQLEIRLGESPPVAGMLVLAGAAMMASLVGGWVLRSTTSAA